MKQVYLFRYILLTVFGLVVRSGSFVSRVTIGISPYSIIDRAISAWVSSYSVPLMAYSYNSYMQRILNTNRNNKRRVFITIALNFLTSAVRIMCSLVRL